MGSLLRKRTRYLNMVKHTDLHKELNQHLDGIGKYVKGEWVTMWARKGNSKDVVTTQFSQKSKGSGLFLQLDKEA